MSIPKLTAKHFREIYFGGNWTASNLKDSLAHVTWEQATTEVYNLNTIATLVYHINYYVDAAIKVLEGEALNAKDKLSFDHPQITNKNEWNTFLTKVWNDGENFSKRIEHVEDHKLQDPFTNEKYGNYFRNLHGIIEHTHYHLGQINLIKKILQQENK